MWRMDCNAEKEMERIVRGQFNHPAERGKDQNGGGGEGEN